MAAAAVVVVVVHQCKQATPFEWRSVASFHKQHHRRVPYIYDLWLEWQHRPDSNPSLHVCPILTWLNLPELLSYFQP